MPSRQRRYRWRSGNLRAGAPPDRLPAEVVERIARRVMPAEDRKSLRVALVAHVPHDKLRVPRAELARRVIKHVGHTTLVVSECGGDALLPLDLRHAPGDERLRVLDAGTECQGVPTSLASVPKQFGGLRSLKVAGLDATAFGGARFPGSLTVEGCAGGRLADSALSGAAIRAGLRDLTVTDCDDLGSLPASLGQLGALTCLEVRRCRNLGNLVPPGSALPPSPGHLDLERVTLRAWPPLAVRLRELRLHQVGLPDPGAFLAEVVGTLKVLHLEGNGWVTRGELRMSLSRSRDRQV